MKTMSQILLGVLMVALVPNVYAGKLNARMANQNRRIHNGVQNGTMTKEEAQKERSDVRAIRAEKREMRKANGGHLTAENRKDLNQQLNQNSKDIYQEKHDGSTAAPAAGEAVQGQ